MSMNNPAMQCYFPTLNKNALNKEGKLSMIKLFLALKSIVELVSVDKLLVTFLNNRYLTVLLFKSINNLKKFVLLGS